MPSIPLRFPKHVEIVNPRLSLFYWALMLGMFVVVLYRFMKLDCYRDIPMAGGVDVMLRPFADLDELQRQAILQAGRPLCMGPRSYDYQSDASWGHRFDNTPCVDLCEKLQIANSIQGCLNTLETYVQESAHKLMIVTQVRETWLNSTGKEPGRAFQMLVPSVEAMGVDLAYDYVVRGAVIEGSESKQFSLELPFSQETALLGSSTTNIMTVFMDQQGVIQRREKPTPTPIRLLVPELLALAGVPGMLDQPQESLGRNQLNNTSGFATGPAGRLSGADFTMSFRCYNTHWRNIGEDWDGPICYVSVHVAQRWTRVEKLDFIGSDELARHRVYHGLRLQTESAGFLRQFDYNIVYTNIASSIVMLGIPLNLAMWFSVFCLGHLSKIYKRVIYEKFDITEQVGGMATRLIANECAFVELQDAVDEQGMRGISKPRMRERLKEALRHQETKLDDGEVRQFVDFCFRAVVQHKHAVQREPEHGRKRRTKVEHARRFFREALGSGSGPLDEKEMGPINIDSFGVACASNERIGFQAVVDLFDRDRPRRCLEHFFTPRYIKKSAPARRPGSSLNLDGFESKSPTPRLFVSHGDCPGLAQDEVDGFGLPAAGTDSEAEAPGAQGDDSAKTAHEAGTRSTKETSGAEASKKNVYLPVLLRNAQFSAGEGNARERQKYSPWSGSSPSTPLEKRKTINRKLRKEVESLAAQESSRNEWLKQATTTLEAVEDRISKLEEETSQRLEDVRREQAAALEQAKAEELASAERDRESSELGKATFDLLVRQVDRLEEAVRDVEQCEGQLQWTLNGCLTEIRSFRRRGGERHMQPPRRSSDATGSTFVSQPQRPTEDV